MKSFLVLALVLTQTAFAESINDISGTFENANKRISKLTDEGRSPASETFSPDESNKRSPASTKNEETHITELTGTFEN